VNVPSFSVVVTARNEARTLPVLLASFAEFLAAGGEFLVLDTGSDDDTVRVAREAGARVEEAGRRFHSVLTGAEAAAIEARFSRRGEGPLVQAGQDLFDFGRARQLAGTLASNDVVWHIDGSDVIESADFEFLDAEVGRGAVAFDYYMRLGGSTFRVSRFFDRRCFAWRGRVHEAPFAADPPRPGRRVLCSDQQLSLRHLKQEKTRNYLAGLALQTMEEPSRPRWRHYLGRELYYFRWFHSAIAALREHARMAHAFAVERGESLCLIGRCLDAVGRPEAAGESFFRAFTIDRSRRQPLLLLASRAQARGDFQQSVAFAAAALTVPRSSPYVDVDENYASDPHALLYWGLFWLGRRDEAKVHWEACRRLAPENEKFREDGRLFAGES
jgi:glycosyltransferase involved in cell wall biosynthesis